MDNLATRLAVATAFLLALLAFAGWRARAARAKAGSAGVAAVAADSLSDGQASAAPPPAGRRWSPWDAVPPGLRDDESGRIIALSAVALKAHTAGALVDLRGAVDAAKAPEDFVLVALDELAADWRAWPQAPPRPEPPSTQVA